MNPSDQNLPFDLGDVLVQFAPDGLLVVDERGGILQVNDRLCELFGYARHELVGEPVELLVPEDERAPHTAHRTRFRAEPAVRTMGGGRTLRGRRRDGSELAIEVGLSPIDGPDGVLVLAVVRDVSEQVALRAQADSIQQVIDAIHDGVFLFDATTLRFTYVNDGAVDQTGYSRAELLAMTPLHIKPHFSEAEFRQLLAPLLAGERTSVEFETVHRRKDGIDTPVEIILEYPPITEPGLDRRLVAIVRDITERTVIDERIRASEAAFRRTFADAPVAMAVMALAGENGGTVDSTNAAFCELFGYACDGAEGLALEELTHPGEHRRVLDVARALQTGAEASDDGEYRLRRADGSWFWGHVRAAALEAEDGSMRALVHITDITGRKAAELAQRRFDAQSALISRLRLNLLGTGTLAVTLSAVCADIRKSELASDAVVLERSESGPVLTAWGLADGAEKLFPGGGLLGDVSAGASVDGTPLVIVDGADLHPADQRFFDDLDAGAVVVGSIGDGRALAVVCSRSDVASESGHDLAALQRLVVDVGEAMALAEARADQQRMRLLRDRERIATDLHDIVIQRLFAAGMRLQAALPVSGEQAQPRIQTVVGELDTTIREIRETIFALHESAARTSLAEDLTDVITSDEEYLGFMPTCDIDPAIDDAPDHVAEHLVPVLTEMLSNVARHAEAESAHVRVTVADGWIELEVSDDGSGIPPDAPHGSGLDNLSRRAGACGGSFTAESTSPRSGTVARWRVPIDPERADARAAASRS